MMAHYVCKGFLLHNAIHIIMHKQQVSATKVMVLSLTAYMMIEIIKEVYLTALCILQGNDTEMTMVTSLNSSYP